MTSLLEKGLKKYAEPIIEYAKSSKSKSTVLKEGLRGISAQTGGDKAKKGAFSVVELSTPGDAVAIFLFLQAESLHKKLSFLIACGLVPMKFDHFLLAFLMSVFVDGFFRDFKPQGITPPYPTAGNHAPALLSMRTVTHSTFLLLFRKYWTYFCPSTGSTLKHDNNVNIVSQIWIYSGMALFVFRL